MIATVKSIDLIDHENWAYWPDDVGDFCVAAEATIGLVDSDGGDIFSFEVCTPRWLERQGIEAPQFAQGLLLVNEYDEASIKSAVIDLVASSRGKSWAEVALHLSRCLRWEYEGYDPVS